MASKITIDALAGEVQSILNEYENEVADAMDDCSRLTANHCAKELRSVSTSMFGGHYGGGWTRKQTSFGRGKEGYTVHNKLAGLPHLLENGHVKVLWGKSTGERVDGRVHIAPVEAQAVKELEERLRAKLS